MDIDRIKDAAKDLSKQQLEDLSKAIESLRRECMLCEAPGAERYNVRKYGKDSGGKGQLLLCDACFAKNRLPEDTSLRVRNRVSLG